MLRRGRKLAVQVLLLLLAGCVCFAQDATSGSLAAPNCPAPPGGEAPREDCLIIDDMEGDAGERWHDVYGRLPEDLVPDEEVLVEGLASGRWEPDTAARYISNSSIPHDWNGYDTLAMSIHSEGATGARMVIILASDSPETEDTDFYRGVTDIDWEGWRELRLTRRSFQVALQPAGWEKIDSIRFGFSGGFAQHVPGTVLRFDDIRVLPVRPPGDDLLVFDSDSDWSCMRISGGALDCALDPAGSGERVAKWADTVLQTYIWNNAAPRDWSAHSYLNLWVYCEHTDEGQFMVWIESDNPETEKQDCYCTRIPLDWEGWKLHTLPLGDLQIVREPKGWDQIDILKFYTGSYCQQGDGTSLLFGDMWLSVEPPRADEG